jgi:hypothetical protein
VHVNANSCHGTKRAPWQAFGGSIFALDLGPLADGNKNVPAVYRDPEHFFRASYLTNGLKSLSQDVLSRLAGKPVKPVMAQPANALSCQRDKGGITRHPKGTGRGQTGHEPGCSICLTSIRAEENASELPQLPHIIFMSPTTINPWVESVILHPDVLSPNFSEDIQVWVEGRNGRYDRLRQFTL